MGQRYELFLLLPLWFLEAICFLSTGIYSSFLRNSQFEFIKSKEVDGMIFLSIILIEGISYLGTLFILVIIFILINDQTKILIWKSLVPSILISGFIILLFINTSTKNKEIIINTLIQNGFNKTRSETQQYVDSHINPIRIYSYIVGFISIGFTIVLFVLNFLLNGSDCFKFWD